jgi:hypothetical protein
MANLQRAPEVQLLRFGVRRFEHMNEVIALIR